MKTVTLVRVAIVLAIVVTLEAACRLGFLNANLIIPPSAMADKLWSLMQTGAFWSELGISAESILISFLAAMVVGCALAFVLHNLPRTREAIEPLIASYYALPFFVLYPLFIVVMGMNKWPIILIGFLYAVMAVIVNGLAGLDRIPMVLRRTGRMHRLSGFEQAIHISLPAASPYVFTGAKLALGYSITGVLGSEFILAESGIGYQISYAYNNFDDRTMYALLLFVVIAVSVLTMLIFKAEQLVRHRSGPAQKAVDIHGGTALSKIVAAVVVALAILACWELAHLRVGSEALAAPGATFADLAALLQTAHFWADIGETSLALGLAVLVSCVLGTVIGVLLGMSRFASEMSSPLLVTLYSLPKVALYPVVLLFVGIGLSAKVTFGAMYGTIPMILIAMNAIRSMNPILLTAARSMHLTPWQKATTVVVPAVLPEIVTGIRVSFSITLLGVMIGEMFASSRGLGYLIMNSISINNTGTMMAVTILIAVVAVVINSGLIAMERAINRG